MTDAIERAWQTALDILKPSESELERGLELHKDAIVFDSYGFAPRFAVNVDAVAEAVEAGQPRIVIHETMESMRLSGGATDPSQRDEFFRAWERSGVTCIFQNAGEEGQSIKRMLKRLADFTFLTDALKPRLQRAAWPEDVERVKAEGNYCLYFSANGVPLVEDWNTPKEELRYIRFFFELGERMAHLTYNRNNMLGGGCAEAEDIGLSDFGRAVVAEINRVGMIVDVAHSSLKTGLDAARASTRPMVASHAVAAGVNEHCRAKTDEVVRAIADTGGYVGVCAIPAFLGHSGRVDAFLDHIDYLAKKFGAERVAIGMDTAYTPPVDKEAQKRMPELAPMPTRWANFWPPKDPLHDPKWSDPKMTDSLAWTNWPLFTVGLVQRGYSDDDIRKIIGGNVMRVARAAVEGIR